MKREEAIKDLDIIRFNPHWDELVNEEYWKELMEMAITALQNQPVWIPVSERLPEESLNTGCSRTGCVLCGFGCHLEKPGEGRFERLKETHPGMYKLLDVIENNGVTYREAIDWINEHGNMNIRY